MAYNTYICQWGQQTRFRLTTSVILEILKMLWYECVSEFFQARGRHFGRVLRPRKPGPKPKGRTE